MQMKLRCSSTRFAFHRNPCEAPPLLSVIPSEANTRFRSLLKESLFVFRDAIT
jgi:hypothetical protein